MKIKRKITKDDTTPVIQTLQYMLCEQIYKMGHTKAKDPTHSEQSIAQHNTPKHGRKI